MVKIVAKHLVFDLWPLVFRFPGRLRIPFDIKELTSKAKDQKPIFLKG